MKTGRLNHIDALRGSVMLLLVPYHGLLFLQNSGASMAGLDLSVFWLHLWRMGLFFAVSGFLAAMTLGLWGPSRQIRQRLKRIGIPLFVAMLTILPAQKLIVLWFVHQKSAGPTKPAYDYTLSNLLGWEPHHLWFLSYVLAFNVAAVVLWLVIRKGPWLATRIDGAFRRCLTSPLLIPLLAVLSAIPLWFGGFTEAPGRVAASLIPMPSAAAYYGVFFLFGWMLFRGRDLLPVVERRPWLRLAVALPAGLLAFVLYSGEVALPELLPAEPTILVVSGVAVWSTIFAVWGFFARFLSGARPWVRYLADASYWVYLIHIPILVATQLAIAESGIPPILRLTIATSVSIALSFVTYALIVRHTAIGRLLHGKRARNSQAVAGEGSPGTPGEVRPGEPSPVAAPKPPAQISLEPDPRPTT